MINVFISKTSWKFESKYKIPILNQIQEYDTEESGKIIFF